MGWETQNMLTSARLMVLAALARNESRGTHTRLDRPKLDSELEGHFTWDKAHEDFAWKARGTATDTRVSRV